MFRSEGFRVIRGYKASIGIGCSGQMIRGSEATLGCVGMG